MNDEPAHARLAPSGAEGWAFCADFPNANAGLDENRRESAEGSIAHQVSDLCLTLGFDAFDFIGTRCSDGEFSFTWDAQDAELLQPRLDRLRGWAALPDAQFYTEFRVRAPFLGPDEFGTLDNGLILPSEGLIVLDDFKWGRYVPVYPVGNLQVSIYALSFWEQIARHVTDITNFLIVIDQPRNAGGGGRWFTTLEELQSIAAWLAERAEATRVPNPPRTATPRGCRWCRRRKQPPTEQGALTGCQTFDRYMLSTAATYFDDHWTAEQRAFLFEHKKLIEEWLESNGQVLLEDAKARRPAGGLKAVTASHGTHAKFNDETAATEVVEELLGDKGFTRKLKTPTQLSKLLTPEEWEKVEPLVTPGVRNTILVPEADARPAVVTADQFDDAEDASPTA